MLASISGLKRAYMKHALILAPIFATCLSACSAPDGEFPSLNKRPFETQKPVEDIDKQPLLISETLPKSISAKLASLQSRHEAAANAYAKLLPAARQSAQTAAGLKAGSENWVSAHVKLSRLDKARADSVSALAEIDKMITTQLETNSDAQTPSFVHLLIPTQTAMANAVAAQNIEIRKLSLLIGL